jgi:hypothetical protein
VKRTHARPAEQGVAYVGGAPASHCLEASSLWKCNPVLQHAHTVLSQCTFAHDLHVRPMSYSSLWQFTSKGSSTVEAHCFLGSFDLLFRTCICTALATFYRSHTSVGVGQRVSVACMNLLVEVLLLNPLYCSCLARPHEVRQLSFAEACACSTRSCAKVS